MKLIISARHNCGGRVPFSIRIVAVTGRRGQRIRILKNRGLHIPILKGGCAVGLVPDPRFILCYSGYTKRYEKAKDPIVENSIFEKESENEKSGFGNYQKIIVGIHAFFCCGEWPCWMNNEALV